MKYGEVCNAALQLMNQYSLAGDNIPATYNNQADYYRRMAELVDDAQMVIAAGPRRIRAAKQLVAERGKEDGPYLRYTLPSDLMEIIPGGLFVYRNDRRFRLPWDQMHYQTGYDRLDEKRILVPRELASDELWLEYYRRPRGVMEAVNEGLTLEDAEMTVPAGATSVIIAGHGEHEEPKLRVLNGDEYETATLTATPATSLNGETGRVKTLNAYLKQDYTTAAAAVTAGDTVRITGWAKPGDAVYAFMNGGTVVSFAKAPTEPDEDTELDNVPETHRPIPYYVAAYLVMPEDAFAYASLHNQWQNLLGSLYQQPQPERGIIENVYDGVNFFEEW